MKSPVLTQRQRPQSQRPHGAGDGRALCSPTGPSQPGSHSNIPIFPARQISTPPAARWWHSQEHPGAEPCCDRVCSPTHTYQHLAVVHGPRCVPQRPQGLKEKEHARLAKPKRGAHPACTASCTRETLTRGATQRRAATRRTPATLTVKPGLHPRTRPATERTAPLTTKAKERKRASKRPCLEVRDVTDASEDVRHVRGSRAIALRTIAPGAPMALAAPAGRTRGGNDRGLSRGVSPEARPSSGPALSWKTESFRAAPRAPATR